MDIITNKPLSDRFRSLIEKEFGEGEILFCIVGDLTLKGVSGESLTVFTKEKITAFDDCLDGGRSECLYSALESLTLKRLYGNAELKAVLKDGEKRDLQRFTYAAASVGDAAAEFVDSCVEDGYSDDLIPPVRAAFDNLRSFCPKCGKKLSHPGAECVNCSGKGKMWRKLSVYIKPERAALTICMLLSAVTTVMSLVPPKITQLMIDDVLPSRDRTRLLWVIAALLATYVMQYALGGIRAYKLRMSGDRIVTGLKKDIYAKAQYLPMSFYDKTSTGSVINRINSDTVVLQNFVMKMTQEAVVQGFLLVGLVVIMFVMDPKLAVLSLIPVPVVVLVGRIFGKVISPKYRRIWRRAASISTLLADSVPGIRVIKAFSGEKNAIGKFSAYCDEWLREDRKVASTAALFPALITFLVTCGSLMIWGLGGDMVMREVGGISVGKLVSFVTYAQMFYNPVNFFANLSDSYQNTIASAEKILDILDASPESNFGEGNIPERIQGKIEFRGVNFSFDRSKKILSNVDLTIEPGDTVGIVGTTGAGKSTLINLLLRYYDEYDGEILVDGQNIKDIDINYFRSQIGYVQQEPQMFRDTVFNNIAYGSRDVHVEQVISAAEVANAHGFISRMPDAYDTMLGERGVGLSGGEKQRVSIARAVLKNPGILIFDEATAAVDSETESLIQDAIDRLIRGRTTIMIAHRLSTLRKANKIVVMDKGKIIECGAPADLLAMKGKYYKLVNIQTMGEELQRQKETERFD